MPPIIYDNRTSGTISNILAHKTAKYDGEEDIELIMRMKRPSDPG